MEEELIDSYIDWDFLHLHELINGEQDDWL